MVSHTTSADGGDSPEVGEFHPARLKRSFPDALKKTQKEALATAIRNPYSSVDAIAEKAGIQNTPVQNAILAFSVGGYKGRSETVTDYDGRLNRGPAWFKDLTVKQRAAVDFVARHPGLYDEFTYEEIAGMLIDDLNVVTHPTYVRNYTRQNPDKVHKRRQWYEQREPDEVVPATEMDGPSEDDARRVEHVDGVPDERVTPTMGRLAAAGVENFPETNLDGLPGYSEQVEKGQRRGGRNSSGGGGNGGGASSASSSQPSGTDAPDTTDGSFGGGSGASVSAESEGLADDATADTTDTGDGSGAVGDRVTRDTGNARYEGPETGVDLTGGGGKPKLLHVAEQTSTIDDELAREFEDAREEIGDFGEDAFRRSVEIDDREDLEMEIRRLRMLSSLQGSMLEALSDTLENLEVTVSFDVPADAKSGEIPDE